MDCAQTCCFSGHRPQKLPWRENERDSGCITLKRRLYDAVEEAYENGYRVFISGMAMGCDLYFCECVEALRLKYPDARLEAAVPCETQTDGWSEAWKKRYSACLEKCDGVTLVQREFSPGCMLRRNRWMADRSSLLIAVFNGDRGGTSSTIEYAYENGLEVRLIPLF